MEQQKQKNLSVELINQHLKTEWLARSICYQTTVDSTNVLAKQLAQKTAPQGLLVIAEEQNAGKGRIGRGWASPFAKGLWFSVVLRPKFPPEEAPKCTLMAAVAVCKAVNEVAGVNAQIKWPNDILLNGKKLVGILSEMGAEYGKLHYVVIGIGLNTNAERKDFPADVQEIAISLHQAATRNFNRAELLARIMENLEELVEEAEINGFGGIFDQWRQMNCTTNMAVKVIAQDETYLGKALDIDDTGMLIVQRENGVIDKVVAGDVSIRYPDQPSPKR